MLVDAFEITTYPTPNKCVKFNCNGCEHLKGLTVDSDHEVYIECDLDKEDYQ